METTPAVGKRPRGKRFKHKKDPSDTSGAEQEKGKKIRLNWVPAERANQHFENYYKTLLQFSDEEWNTFYTTMQSDLPTTFRVNGSAAFRPVLTDILGNYFGPNLVKELSIEQDLCHFEKLPW